MMNEKYMMMDDLIISFLKGSISLSDKEKLEKWLASDTANRDYFKQIYKIWNTLDLIDMDPALEERMLEKIKYRISQDQPVTEKKTGKFRTIVLSVARWAAVIVISFGLGVAVVQRFSKVPEKLTLRNEYNGITIPLGSKSLVDLPDGTRVILNAGSKLTYQTDYGKETREVELSGEGYFKVAKDKTRSFIVHTSKANIRALGTEFNVKAYPDEDMVETILVKGAVVVDEIDGIKGTENKSILLKPGQKIRLFKNSQKEKRNLDHAGKTQEIKPIESLKAKLMTSDPVVETSWKDERWIIKGEGMQELSVLLSRHFNVDIRIQDQELTKYKFSGTIQNETIEQVCDIIRLTIPLSFTIEKGQATWSINRSLEKDYEKAYQSN